MFLRDEIEGAWRSWLGSRMFQSEGSRPDLTQEVPNSPDDLLIPLGQEVSGFGVSEEAKP